MFRTIDNFLSPVEVNLLKIEIDNGHWKLQGTSNDDLSKPVFWVNNIIQSRVNRLFTEKIQTIFKRKISVNYLYVNGQAHGQCGDWHTDVNPGTPNCFTMVYFYKEWPPEFGGHLLIKTNPITSILPVFNTAIIFDSTIEHMGMEPTMHCKTQRESVACKFKVIDD